MAWGARARIAAIAALVLPGLVGVVGTAPPALASAPVFLDVAPGAVLEGRLDLRVQSTAPYVRIGFLGSAFGYVVPTVGGVATWDWESYGQANGPTTVTADACPAGGDTGEPCDRGHAELAVVLDNARPVLTWPTTGATISGLVTYRATAPEGGVAFRITGCGTGSDYTAPYEATRDTADCREGTWPLTAVRCSRTGCDGPASAAAVVTITNLHPAVVARSTPAIDPARGQARDTVRWTYRFGRAQEVRWRILDRTGEVVRDWTALGRQPAGDHTIAWAGHGDGGVVPPDGTYLLEIRTRAGELQGRADSSVQVLTHPPRLQVLGTTATRFYPVRDGFRDLFRPHARRGDVRLTLEVTDAAGRLVRTIRAAQRVRMPVWNGRDSHGCLLPAGAYRWRLVAEDLAGHRTRSSWRTVALSHRRAELATLTSAVRAVRSSSTFGTPCALIRTSAFGPTGRVLANGCARTDAGAVPVGAAYRIAAPEALAYRSVSLEAYARAGGVPLAGELLDEDGASVAEKRVTVTGPRWYPVVSATRVIGPDGIVRAQLWVDPRDPPPAAVDLRTVRVSVRAYVWAD
jgi:hypothetical protein